MKYWPSCLLLVLTLLAQEAPAQSNTGKSAQGTKGTQWPQRPVRVVVPFPAGGSTDIIARLVSPHLTEEFGQQFIVDNRSGAGGTIGAEIAARATPDGYTVAVIPSSYAGAAALYPLSFDPVKGIAPISMIGTGSFILGVHPSVPAQNFKALIDLLRPFYHEKTEGFMDLKYRLIAVTIFLPQRSPS